jgi:hypothetical protein
MTTGRSTDPEGTSTGAGGGGGGAGLLVVVRSGTMTTACSIDKLISKQRLRFAQARQIFALDSIHPKFHLHFHNIERINFKL